MLRVASLHIHPVKSLRACTVPGVELDALGFAGDRRFLVVDAKGEMLTQRTLPHMARVSTGLTRDELTLTAGGMGSISVARAANAMAPVLNVTVWKSTGLRVEDCGDAPAAWLSEALRLPCRLVRIGDAFRRPVLKPAARAGDVTSFVDAAPILVISEASMEELNARIRDHGGDQVPMDRFRPNLVVSGCTAFAEDEWVSLQIGSIKLRAAGKCERCILTTTDQFTGERGKEPLRTLSTFRRDPMQPGGVYFGVNFIHESPSGLLHAGDAAAGLTKPPRT